MLKMMPTFIDWICLIVICWSLLSFNQFANALPSSKATFAGGCFWCMQHAFDDLEGVIATKVGYTGGHSKDPIYPEVSSGVTGHAESIQIDYDSSKISYEELLNIFWHNIDPTVKDRQFCDKGSQYRSAIFYHNENQKHLAEKTKQQLIDSQRFKHIFTEITPVSTFYIAEDYHQDYHKKNPFRYKVYGYLCGRDQRLKELWTKSL